MRGCRGFAVLLVLLLSASTSFAAGFRLPEAGNKANAMAFAFTAQADNPSAIYYNPAGLTQLERNNLALGVTYTNLPGGEFTGTTPLSGGPGETQKDLDFFLPNLYYTHTSKDGWIAYGVGVFAPFGLGQEYENPNISIFRNQITKIDLKTVVVNPTIAFKIVEGVSVGFGVDFMYGMAELEKKLVLNNGAPSGSNPLNAYDSKLDGDGTAWGYNFGILVKATPNLRFGANFRSPFTLEIEGADVDISNISSTSLVIPGFGGASPYNVFGNSSTYHTTGSTKVKMPATAAVGMSYIWDRLTVEVDADWTFWSSYQSLDITIDQGNVLLRSTSAAKNWKDVCALRTGLEFRVSDPVALRAGFSYDPTPVPAETLGPELPDATRLYYTAGAGFKFGNWTIDISGIYIDKKDRNVANQGSNGPPPTGSYPQYANGANGTWTGSSWLAGLDIAYRF